MNAESSTITPYRPSDRSELIDLWNRAFSSMPNFLPFDRQNWVDRIERDPDFDPEFLLVAREGGEFVGFLHGGIWSGEFLELLIPDRSAIGNPDSVGYLAMIAVDDSKRRSGTGSALVAELRLRVAARAGSPTPILVDGRMYNPFYGNFHAPLPCPWGTTEGASVLESEAGVAHFLRSQGFDVDGPAVTLEIELGPKRPSPTTSPTPDVSVDVVQREDYHAILGATGGQSYPRPNDSRAWVALDGEIQVGLLTIYPLDPAVGDDPVERWGIHGFEVYRPSRGRGVGRQLLTAALDDLDGFGARTCETLVLPDSAPGAVRLYEQLGFVEKHRWLVFT